MIPGVELIPLVTHPDERGFFREILKSNQITKFGQWSMSYMHTGVIKAWHYHHIQYDYWFVVQGSVKAVLADLRGTHWPIQDDQLPEFEPECYEYLLGEHYLPQVLVIPPGVAHGLKVLQGPAVLMYITSEPYNPKDEGRIAWDSLGYNWDKREIK